MSKSLFVASMAVLSLTLGACSSDGDAKPDSGGGIDLLLADTTSADSGPACDYPAGPYGTTEGKLVENFEFKAFADANYQCKDPADQVMDLSKTRKVSFKDYFCNSSCPEKKKKILWVMVSAGWCGPCQQEVAETQAQYGKGALDPRVHLINILYEDDKSKPVTEEFGKLWAKNNQFQLTFPVALDPQFTMGKYFDRNAVPFNMLVDLDTMKIIFRQTGANLPAVGQAIFNYLNK